MRRPPSSILPSSTADRPSVRASSTIWELASAESLETKTTRLPWLEGTSAASVWAGSWLKAFTICAPGRTSAAYCEESRPLRMSPTLGA